MREREGGEGREGSRGRDREGGREMYIFIYGGREGEREGGRNVCFISMIFSDIAKAVYNFF